MLVLGVGVAGLQAIATAKRLGAVIEASDVRPSVKDQVESLGAKWVDVPYETPEEKEIAEGVGGYARPMPPAWMARQGGDRRRAREGVGHRDHDRVDSRTPRAEAHQGRDRRGDEARFGDRRPGGGAGRQRRGDESRRDRRRRRREGDRAWRTWPQPSRPMRRRCTRETC